MIRQLVEVNLSLARPLEETDRILRERARLGAKTDRRLDALIDTVDKLARRNGP